MNKQVEIIRNDAGGYDLLTERDAGNEIRILTGKRARSLAFWRRIIQAANEAIDLLDPPSK